MLTRRTGQYDYASLKGHGLEVTNGRGRVSTGFVPGMCPSHIEPMLSPAWYLS